MAPKTAQAGQIQHQELSKNVRDHQTEDARYATGSLQFVDLDRALDRIIDDLPNYPGMRQLSISLGLAEQYMGGPQGEIRIQDSKFLRLAAVGVNVFVSSGDAGSNPDDGGHSATGPRQVEFESSDPFAIGVGERRSRLADQRGRQRNRLGRKRRGESIYFSRPVWQAGPGIQPGTQRLVPDVSLIADPNTGGLVILDGADNTYGGTSWSAPVWAGFCALINQARNVAGKDSLSFLPTLLYPLAGTSSFRDITEGNNGGYHSGAGHDMVTGLGVPNVGELIRALTA